MQLRNWLKQVVKTKLNSVFFLAIALLHIVPTALAGLVVDRHMGYGQSLVGDYCDYYAYQAFRHPIIEIIVRTHGNLKEQNYEIARFESFYYTNASNITTHYDYVPIEFQDIICRSKRVPLMCQLKDSINGTGVCVCLEVNVTDESGDKDLFRVIRTTPDESKNRAGSSDGEDSDEMCDVFGVPLPCDYTKCEADFGTFCGTPYINCKPYKDLRGKPSTACVLDKCGTADLIPKALHLFLVVSAVLLIKYV